MGKVEPNLVRPAPLAEEEDDATLAAINRGIRDGDAGRLTPIEEVEKELEKWRMANGESKSEFKMDSR